MTSNNNTSDSKASCTSSHYRPYSPRYFSGDQRINVSIFAVNRQLPPIFDEAKNGYEQKAGRGQSYNGTILTVTAGSITSSEESLREATYNLAPVQTAWRPQYGLPLFSAIVGKPVFRHYVRRTESST